MLFMLYTLYSCKPSPRARACFSVLTFWSLSSLFEFDRCQHAMAFFRDILSCCSLQLYE
jgi:hypothetical protein